MFKTDQHFFFQGRVFYYCLELPPVMIIKSRPVFSFITVFKLSTHSSTPYFLCWNGHLLSPLQYTMYGVCAKLLQSCLTFCTLGTIATRLLCPWDCPGKNMEWVAMPNAGIKQVSFMSPALAGGFFTASATWEAQTLVKLSMEIKLCWFILVISK